ncbi:MAG: response regulator [Gammaproteobacteria bacterium]|nr:response regulator [Gammaproteobacteria bacterium]
MAFLSDSAAPAAAPAKPSPEAASKGCAALVVDDSLPVRIQLDQALKAFAQKVDFAETGEEAFELINGNNYDLIFLDVILPGVDGYEICKVIKQGKAKDTPVIMLTSNSSPADRIKGKLAGCDTYLIKPVGEAVFQEVVHNYLKKPRKISSATV